MSSSSKASDEAIAWLTQQSDGPLSDQQKADFAKWLEESAENAEAYQAQTQIMDQLSNPNLLDPELLESIRVKSKAKPRRFVLPMASAAAACFLIFFVFAFQFTGVPGLKVETARAEQLSFILPDGTAVELDAASDIRYDFSEELRRVTLLEGAAVFDIAEDDRPFEVHISEHIIRDIGTVFSVKMNTRVGERAKRKMPFDVAVAEGEVIVLNQESETERAIVAGEKSYFLQANRISAEVLPVAEEQFAPWRQATIWYEARSLSEVLADLQRHFEGEIILQDDSLGEKTVTGVMKLDDLNAAFDALTKVLPLEVEWAGDSEVIVKVDPLRM